MAKLISTRHFPQSATAFIAAAILGGALMVGLPGTARTASEPEQTASVSTDRCVGGTEVSSFVCRNTWMAHSKFSTR